MMSYRFDMPTTAKPAPAPIPRRARPIINERSKSKGPVPFDPEDLSRRLIVVLSEREERSRKKAHDREVRARLAASVSTEIDSGYTVGAGASGSDHVAPALLGATKAFPPDTAPTDDHRLPYRHMPEVAASQFSRTTTVDPRNKNSNSNSNSSKSKSSEGKSLVHELSMRAMRFTNSNTAQKDDTSRTAAHDARHCCPAISGKTDDSHPRRLEKLAQRHTLSPRFLSKSRDSDDVTAAEAKRFSDSGANYRRRDSCDLPEMALLSPDSQTSFAGQQHPMVDWTQSDEGALPASGGVDAQPRYSAVAAEKHESKWAIMSRFGQKNKSPPKSPVSLRATRSAFFTRFKR
ncbi:hypothetical protein GMORB2_6320 [Geosmithia morbida]|uniref:Uncharacterized protein n=1 Tax=Geosmithia morbida TaxID=1094350 RepID=A0A9P5D6L0_9HYPO|nr:uncharacterized protein GMORB2_6320 [Geosmithia morbida]KAF4123619.1 hypothetical protein GMORB2_6320 [Geosmithia morbida]